MGFKRNELSFMSKKQYILNGVSNIMIFVFMCVCVRVYVGKCE